MIIFHSARAGTRALSEERNVSWSDKFGLF